MRLIQNLIYLKIMDNHDRKLSDEDYQIEKHIFLTKVANLCADFLKKTGDNMLSMGIESRIRDLVVDSNGNTCRGAVMEIDALTWYSDPDEDPLEDFDPDDDD